MKQLTPLTAISPIDGRYWSKVQELSDYFSEFALIKYRVKTEAYCFLAYTDYLPQLQSLRGDKKLEELLVGTCQNFSEKDALWVKNKEKKINHDVKSVEYFVKNILEKNGYGKYKEFVHLGLTSQDLTNTALPMMVKEGLQVMYMGLNHFLEALQGVINVSNIPMLARTHGQPASPTKLSKELTVFLYRLEKLEDDLKQIPHEAKFGGATGNFNAHQVAYPFIDWESFANKLLSKLGLGREYYTTQIQSYDFMARQFDYLKGINNVLVDLCQDVWTYISMGYFTQKIKKGEVGSSAMPHKVNPIDFENAEGNLLVANSMFDFLSSNLTRSRLQRDLTDSTVTRNIGVPFAHTLLVLKSLIKGLGKLVVNEKRIYADLEANWAVVSEAIQTILRREGYPQPYEALKKLTRVEGPITQETITTFINEELEGISSAVKEELLAITPCNYTGIY